MPDKRNTEITHPPQSGRRYLDDSFAQEIESMNNANIATQSQTPCVFEHKVANVLSEVYKLLVVFYGAQQAGLQRTHDTGTSPSRRCVQTTKLQKSLLPLCVPAKQEGLFVATELRGL